MHRYVYIFMNSLFIMYFHTYACLYYVILYTSGTVRTEVVPDYREVLKTGFTYTTCTIELGYNVMKGTECFVSL
jgi:hypothetical protein